MADAAMIRNLLHGSLPLRGYYEFEEVSVRFGFSEDFFEVGIN